MNKPAKLRRHASWVHFAKIHFGKIQRDRKYAALHAFDSSSSKVSPCRTVILIGAQWLSCGSQRLSCGAHGYPAVHNGYPGQTWVGARDTCVSKKHTNQKRLLCCENCCRSCRVVNVAECPSADPESRFHRNQQFA